eukprot:SAG25_NODE_791_length_5300_cov_1.525476_5_plen_55_part_00
MKVKVLEKMKVAEMVKFLEAAEMVKFLEAVAALESRSPLWGSCWQLNHLMLKLL